MIEPAKLTIQIAGQPPSGNHMYEGFGKNRHKKEGVETYQAGVTYLVRDVVNEFRWTPPRPQIIVEFYMYLRQSVDATNVMKVIEDGIGAALCHGDRPPMCCRKFDDRILCRAMALETGHQLPYVELVMW